MAKRKTSAGRTSPAVALSAENLVQPIEAAFAHLHMRPATEEHLQQTIKLLAKIAVDRSKPDQAGNAFKRANRRTCEAQLRSILNAADALISAVNELHEPTILALAQVGVMRTDLLLRATHIKEVVGRADLSQVVSRLPKGRPSDEFARDIASHLASNFQLITGKRPTIGVHAGTHPETGQAYGPFIELVTRVFAAMGIRARPEFFAREAVKDFTDRDTAAIAAHQEKALADGMEHLVQWWRNLSAEEQAKEPPYMHQLVQDWISAHPPTNGENKPS
jgi:hypothetical protein